MFLRISLYANFVLILEKCCCSFDYTEDEITEGIDRAHEQGLTVVMAWVTSENIDIPQEDLNALKKAVTYMHETYPDPDMKFIVYQAPLEIITENVDKNRDGDPDKGVRSISTEHPEWLQVELKKGYIMIRFRLHISLQTKALYQAAHQ